MLPPCAWAAVVVLLGGFAALGAEPDGAALERRFDEVVRPFLRDHCLGCHGPEKPKAKLDLSLYSSVAAVVQDYRRLGARRRAARGGGDAARRRHAAPEPRRAAGRSSTGSRSLREREARKNAGDPGPVLARRLSNAEFDYTIRDLTGVDIRPTREFPVDPANEAGFDNSGESLAMSPALVKKYLAAARLVADHLVLKPDGFVFAPHPAVDRHRPRQVLRPAHHRLLPAAQGRLRRLLPGRLAIPAPRRARQARTRRCADFAGEAGLSPRYLAHGLGGRSAEPLAGGRSARASRRRSGANLPADARRHGRRPPRLRADARPRRPPAADVRAARARSCR